MRSSVLKKVKEKIYEGKSTEKEVKFSIRKVTTEGR
jgi:hypothetical protein